MSEQVFVTAAAATSHRRGARLHWRAARKRFAPPSGAACSGHRLAAESGRAPGEVPDDLRCDARGCRERWATIDGTAALFEIGTEG